MYMYMYMWFAHGRDGAACDSWHRGKNDVIPIILNIAIFFPRYFDIDKNEYRTGLIVGIAAGSGVPSDARVGVSGAKQDISPGPQGTLNQSYVR